MSTENFSNQLREDNYGDGFKWKMLKNNKFKIERYRNTIPCYKIKHITSLFRKV